VPRYSSLPLPGRYMGPKVLSLRRHAVAVKAPHQLEQTHLLPPGTIFTQFSPQIHVIFTYKTR
jgi:hypothetical protein